MACPGCATRTGRVHGYIHRQIADLPVGGRRVLICLRARRMRCPSLDCPRQTFREQPAGVIEWYQRRTVRLTTQVGIVVRELAGRAGARVLGGLGVALSPQTALRALMRVGAHVIPGACAHVIPQVVGPCGVVLPGGLLGG
ncbi:transposase family protein [Sciscionella sediminilitoris]|uniref:transposase family protein n=1 Tax=Sciscionella sediminilitoris TaxID=1445613 RepID=UPI00210175B5|nr:transposase family protein [Sciscionella sp. SE31]